MQDGETDVFLPHHFGVQFKAMTTQLLIIIICHVFSIDGVRSLDSTFFTRSA